MIASQIGERREMACDVVVQIDTRERRHPRIVIRAERGRQAAALAGFSFERRRELAPESLASVLATDDHRMKLPYPAGVSGQAAHPPEDQIGVAQREREPFAQNGRDLLAGQFQVRPPAGFIEPGNQEVCGLFNNGFGLTVEIDDAHARGT